MNKPTKTKLLELLKKHDFVKQDTAIDLGLDEKSIRRWCLSYGIDTEYEKKKMFLDHKPSVIVPYIKPMSEKSAVEKDNLLKRCFIFSDLQIPYHNKAALSIALKRCTDYKPTHVVIIGDFLDYAPLLGKDGLR